MAAFAAVLLLTGSLPAAAADLTIFATGSMAEPLKALADAFTAKTGHRIRFELGPTGVVLGKVRAGERVDVVVLSSDGADALDKEGRLLSGTRRPIARSLFGVGVRKGAPRPDLSTEEAFKTALLNARSLSYSDPKLGSASGIYVEKVFDRLGIAAQARSKTIIKPIGLDVTEAVAKGEVELALTFISEMAANKGVEIAGPFPPSLQNPTLYVAAVTAGSGNPGAAGAFIAFAAGPEAAMTLKEAGVDPASAGH